MSAPRVPALNKRTFLVAVGDRKMEVTQHATFAHYIEGKQFRFVVTDATDAVGQVVTHRASGMKVCAIPMATYLHGPGNHKERGIAALESLIARVGADKVACVLTAKEREIADGVTP